MCAPTPSSARPTPPPKTPLRCGTALSLPCAAPPGCEAGWHALVAAPGRACKQTASPTLLQAALPALQCRLVMLISDSLTRWAHHWFPCCRGGARTCGRWWSTFASASTWSTSTAGTVRCAVQACSSAAHVERWTDNLGWKVLQRSAAARMAPYNGNPESNRWAPCSIPSPLLQVCRPTGAACLPMRQA